MNNKIKEILDIKDDTDYKRLSIEDILLLKEYIEKLEKKVELYQATTTFGDYVGMINNLIELQCRIKEATEYIVNKTKDTDFDNDRLIPIYEILKGSDKDD